MNVTKLEKIKATRNNKIFYIAFVDILKGHGAVTHVIEIVKSWRNSGSQVTTFLPRFNKKAYNNIFKATYIPVLNFPNVKRVLFEMQCFFCLCFHAIKQRPNFIYSRICVFSFASILFSKIFRIKHIAEVNGKVREEMKIIGNSRLQILIATFLRKLNFKYSDSIICVADALKKDLIEVYKIKKEKILVMNNGVNIQKFKPLLADWIYSKYNLEENISLVGFIGSLFKWQGLETLIKSILYLIKERKDVRFVIVGEGREIDALKKIAQDYNVRDFIIFTGAVPYEQVPLLINSFSVCIAPLVSERQASPIKVYEYLACEKPVIASDVSDMKKLLEDNECGFVVEPDNPLELGKKISLLLSNKNMVMEMGKKGRIIVENNTWKLIAQHILNYVT